MPRLRRSTLSAEVQAPELESPQLQLQPVKSSRPSLQDPAKFFRAIVEIERVRGLRVHPESPTVH